MVPGRLSVRPAEEGAVAAFAKVSAREKPTGRGCGRRGRSCKGLQLLNFTRRPCHAHPTGVEGTPRPLAVEGSISHRFLSASSRFAPYGAVSPGFREQVSRTFGRL